MTPRVFFEPWHDPFAHVLAHHRREHGDIDDEEDDDPYGSRSEFDPYSDDPPKQVGPCVSGPMGLMPVREGLIPSKQFDMWVCHTNFDVPRDAWEALKGVPGVEVLDPVTRYRFRVGIARLFDRDEVKGEIENVLVESFFSGEFGDDGGGGGGETTWSEADVLSLVEGLLRRSAHPAWVVYEEGGKYGVAAGATGGEALGRLPEGATRLLSSWEG